MTVMFQLQNSTALITGASAGLGSEFVRQLGGVAKALVLVARRGDRLLALEEELLAAHPQLEIYTYSVDLTRATERERFLQRLGAQGIVPDLLINNAGMGDYGDFGASDWDKVEALLQLNMVALTHLTHALLPVMRVAGGAAIINVSSLASLLPIPDFVAYAASKAYVSSFSESLRHELRAEKVNVVALCPGPVKTEFGDIARREGSGKLEAPGGKMFYTEARVVVSKALRAAESNKPRVFPGLPVFLTAMAIEALPAPLLRFILGKRDRYDEGGAAD